MLKGKSEVVDVKAATESFQKECILNAINKSKGNWSAAARSLNVDRANLIRIANRLNIQVKKKSAFNL